MYSLARAAQAGGRHESSTLRLPDSRFWAPPRRRKKPISLKKSTSHAAAA